MENPEQSPKAGVSRLFREHQPGVAVSDERDEWGFVKPVEGHRRIDEFLESKAILIVGRPWTGKSYVASQLAHQPHFTNGAILDSRLDQYTPARTIAPSGWEHWRTGKSHATWLIDSLDEGEIIQRNVHQLILDELRRLDRLTRDRLRVVVFCRQAEVPDGIVDGLSEIYRDDFVAIELLLLDYENARRMVTAADYQKTLEHIKKHHLDGICQFPSALKFISNNLGRPLKSIDVWKGVLQELIQEKNPAKAVRASSGPESEEQFDAAARLAVVMTFSGIDRVLRDGESGTRLTLRDLIPYSGADSTALRNAARCALSSSMFWDGRFSQKHIREWMCAFGLKSIGLGKLKGLLTDNLGELSRQFRPAIGLLRDITERADVREWIDGRGLGLPPSSDLRMLDHNDAIQIVDRLEQIADSSPWGLELWSDKNLADLRAGNIGKDLAARIEDDRRSDSRRTLLLQVVLATESREAVPSAIALVKQFNRSDRLLETAMVVLRRLATEDQLRQLESFVKSAKPKSRVQRAVISSLIRGYLDSAFWTPELAVRHAPKPNYDVVDSTYMLQKTLVDSLDVASARFIVNRDLRRILNGKQPQRGLGADRMENEMFTKAVALLGQQEPPNDKDLFRLIPLALNQWELVPMLDFNFYPPFGKSAAARRAPYSQEIHAIKAGGVTRRHREYRWLLRGDDIDWLIEQLPELEALDGGVWEDLLNLAENSQSDPLLGQRALSHVETNRPEVIAAFSKSRREWEQWQQKRADDIAKQEGERKRIDVAISDAVEQILGWPRSRIQQQMHELSWICFGGDQGKPSNVIGTWSDVDAAAQECAVDVCIAAIRECVPTAIADGNALPSRVLYEAWCFRFLVAEHAAKLALDSELIRKWLPSVFVWITESDKRTISACRAVDSLAAEDVFNEAILRDLRSSSDFAAAAGNIDSEYWTAALTDTAVRHIIDSRFAEPARARLLTILAIKTPGAATGIARKLLNSDSEGPLRIAALEILLSAAPIEAWPYLRSDFGKRGKDALLPLGRMYDYQQNAPFVDWPAEQLVRLFGMLSSSFPPSRKAEDRGGWVTAEWMCRRLCDAIPAMLFYRKREGDRIALEALVRRRPKLAKWLRSVEAEETAKGLISGSFLPYQRVVHLLENAEYRLVRNSSDLFEIIEEQLIAIGEDIPEDIELLYSLERGKARRRRVLQNEGTLQAYVFRRLCDMLPGRVLDAGTTIKPIREPQIAYRGREDLEIIAPSIGGAMAIVVVEIKWSTNRDIQSALQQQLGNQYLYGEKSHGIFLVAWTGKLGTWKNEKHRPGTPADLKIALDRIAKGYCEKRPEVTIRPIVWNAEWREPVPRPDPARK